MWKPWQNQGSGADESVGSNCGIFFFSLVSLFKIFVEELEDKVLVNCNTSIRWVEGTMGKLISDNKSLDLGKRALDPRGVYMCEWTNEQPSRMSTVQVYYRSMCFLDPSDWNGSVSGSENLLVREGFGGPICSLNKLESLLQW